MDQALARVMAAPGMEWPEGVPVLMLDAGPTGRSTTNDGETRGRRA